VGGILGRVWERPAMVDYTRQNRADNIGWRPVCSVSEESSGAQGFEGVGPFRWWFHQSISGLQTDWGYCWT